MTDPFSSVQPLIEAVEQAETATALLAATSQLASHLASSPPPAPQAINALVQVLGFNNPGAAVAAVDGLIACGEAAVAPLQARLASGPAVAGAQEPGTPRLREPCDALLEALGQIGVANPEVLAVIRPFVEHERPLIRSAACRALLQLTAEPHWGQQLVALLQHQQLQVRRAALMDLGAAGWRPALEPIAATLAENSLKLIALRGLVENRAPVVARAAVGSAGEPQLNEATEAVLAAMDALL